LNKALKAVSKIYEVKRKKIQLDNTFIKEVQQKHIGTVELLNEYLKDDDENLIIIANKETTEDVNTTILQIGKENGVSIYLSDITLNAIQSEVLEIFFENNLSISLSDLEVFAKSKGFFKNQLIESINETCYAILDDILIEEDENFYTIDEDYYQKLLIK
jgi:TerB-C domain